MDSINVSTAAVALGRIMDKSPSKYHKQNQYETLQIFKLLSSCMVRCLLLMGKRSVVNCIWCIAKVQQLYDVFECIGGTVVLYGHLLRRSAVVSHTFIMLDYYMVLWSMAVCKQCEHPLFPQYAKNIAKIDTAEFSCQSLSNILWTFAISKFKHAEIIEDLVEKVKLKIKEFNGQDLGVMMWALAELGYHDKQLMYQVEYIVLNKCRELPQYARQNYEQQQVQNNSDDINKLNNSSTIINIGSDLKNTQNQINGLKIYQDFEFGQNSIQQRKIKDFIRVKMQDPYDIQQQQQYFRDNTNITHISKKLKQNQYFGLKFCCKYKTSCKQQEIQKYQNKQLQTQNSSNEQYPKQYKFDQSDFQRNQDQQCMYIQNQNSEENYANFNQKFYSNLINQKAQNLMQYDFNFDKLQTCAEENKKVEKAIYKTTKQNKLLQQQKFQNSKQYVEFSNQSATNLLFAFSQFGLFDTRCAEILATKLLNQLDIERDNIQSFVNTIFYLSIIQSNIQTVQSLLNILTDHIIQKNSKIQDLFEEKIQLTPKNSQFNDVDLNDLNSTHLRQIYYAHLLYKVEGEDLNIPDQIFEFCRNAWIQMIWQDYLTPNNFIFEVGSALNGLLENYQSFKIIENGEMILNIGGEKDGRKIAIQVLDSNCYTMNQPRRMMGHARSRLRCIHQIGWTIVDVPFYEWDMLLLQKWQKVYLNYKIQQLLGK